MNTWPGLDASGLDELFDVANAEANMPADFVEGDASFGDESPYEAR